VTFPRDSSLSKRPTVAWHTSKCNFFYTHMKNIALPHPVLIKLTHLNTIICRPFIQNFNQIRHWKSKTQTEIHLCLYGFQYTIPNCM